MSQLHRKQIAEGKGTNPGTHHRVQGQKGGDRSLQRVFKGKECPVISQLGSLPENHCQGSPLQLFQEVTREETGVQHVQNSKNQGRA